MRRKEPAGTIIRRAPQIVRGRMAIRLVGHYFLGEESSLYVVELVINAPWYALYSTCANMACSRSQLTLYTTPDWDNPPEPISPQFILDARGEKLIGSYLHDLPFEPLTSRTPQGYTRPTVFRFASFLPENYCGGLLTPIGILPLPDPEPIPERLLRLIWIEG